MQDCSISFLFKKLLYPFTTNSSVLHWLEYWVCPGTSWNSNVLRMRPSHEPCNLQLDAKRFATDDRRQFARTALALWGISSSQKHLPGQLWSFNGDCKLLTLPNLVFRVFPILWLKFSSLTVRLITSQQELWVNSKSLTVTRHCSSSIIVFFFSQVPDCSHVHW